jgi:hypothetical protein
MKRYALVVLCFLSSFASANDIELVIAKLSETHKQNPITGNWHYVEKKKEPAKKT